MELNAGTRRAARTLGQDLSSAAVRGGQRRGRARGIVITLAVLSTVGALAAACSEDGGQSTSDPPSSSQAPNTAPSAVRIPAASLPAAEGAGISALGTQYDVESLGYTREEFFLEGAAVAYEPVEEFAEDGKWQVEEGASAEFRTRMVVIAPANPADFDGTVFVEWFNVSGGFDTPPSWLMTHNQILRSGAAWVGVSAQAAGVVGSDEVIETSIVEVPEGGLVGSDPDRYGALTHPGDAYSYDIFTQAGSALQGAVDGVEPLEGYDVDHIIAIGQSQSASRLVTYVDAVHPLADVYDGFLIQDRAGRSAPLGDQSNSEVIDDFFGSEDRERRESPIPDAVRIRDDLETPVFTFQTESELIMAGFADARQPDSPVFRLWEVAGTSHVDAYTGGPALADLGDGAAELAVLDPARASGGPLGCAAPVNAGGQHAVVSAALAHLERWVRSGTPPPEFPRLETTGSSGTVELVRDEHGIATGGVRTPIVEVPLAVNDGNPNTPDTCRSFGTTTALAPEVLAELYPNGSRDYVAAFQNAAARAVEEGVWLEPEAQNFTTAAGQITLG